jgi:hypothetical protein
MNIREVYSHLNGQEFILVHHASVWTQLTEVVSLVDAEGCRVKESKEKRSLEEFSIVR